MKTRHMKTIGNITAAAALLACASTGAARADSTPTSFRIAPGETLMKALARARLDGMVAQARKAGDPRTRQTAHQPGAIVDPVISNGTLVSTSLTVGQANSIPEFTFTYKTGPAGLVGVVFFITSPNGLSTVYAPYYVPGYTRSGTVTVSIPASIPYFAQPGQWQITGVNIEDYAGNYTSYTQAQSAALFPPGYVNVVNNGPVDITPPVVTAGQILTPKVSLSSKLPEFEATLTGTDDVSGIFQAYVAIEPPGGSYGQVNYVPVPVPTLSGTVNAYSQIFAGQPTGTWSITQYVLCDVAANCVDDASSTDIQTLFGTTTFQVTK